MKRYIAAVLILAALSVPAVFARAQDKVVVIPFGSSTGGPGDWKNVAVSSLGGIPRDSELRTGISSNCGELGRYANGSYGVEFLTVPLQLPDGATIVSFTGLMCDTRNDYLAEMLLKRSDNHNIAQVMTGVSETSTSPLAKTDTTILEGAEIVDNSKYSYFVYMSINGNAGSAIYPVSAIVTLK
jgi:hypothetical protein